MISVSQHALADDLRIDALAEILEARELLFLALGDDVLDRRVADALQRRQRIEDPVLADLEVAEAASSPTAAPPRCRGACASWRKSASLSVLRHVERHRRGQELDRVMRLQIGGLVGDDAHRPRRATC